jgi:penicillin G amidase
MRRILKLIVKLALIIILLVSLTGTSGYFYLRRSLPQTVGTIRTPGLQKPIEIVRDSAAIPHIYASSQRDAYFGLGYVHAQDRLWQMELHRRSGQGRLSEVFGPATLPADRGIRIVGLHRAASSTWNSLPHDTKDLVNAYVAGINAYIATYRSSKLPPEFSVFGLSPEPWTGEDVLAWLKMIAWDFGSDSHTIELLRGALVQAVGVERAHQLLPGYPEEQPISMPAHNGTTDYEGLLALREDIWTLRGRYGATSEGIGSNSWVVDGTKSITGKPVLANDPHLGATVPSLWYLAHLSFEDQDVIGASIPGLPAIIIGRNRSIAWGITNAVPDVQDLFHERLDVTGRMAEYNGRMEPMQLITETIKIKDRPDTQQLVRITRHGPLISDAINANNEMLPADQRFTSIEPSALRWSALDPEDTTIEAILQVNRAHDWQEFKHALKNYIAPPLNFIYADMAGNIGSYMSGHIPIRANDTSGLPVEGWAGKHEWVGWIPFDELPHSYNPPQHFIVSANNRPVPESYPYFLGREWAAPYRVQRITELLQSKHALSLEDQVAIQGDTVSLQARELLPKLLELVHPSTPEEGQALELLKTWNNDTRGDSVPAAIYEAWLLRLPDALLSDELDQWLIRRYEGDFSFVSRFLANTIKDRKNEWCDNVATTLSEDCASIAQTTFREALQDLKMRLGSDINQWHWSQLHMLTFRHQPFDNIPPLQPFFNRSIPNGGDQSTVNVGPFAFEYPFEQDSTAGYRQIIDLSISNESRFILALGQSGHFLSSHYDDYLADWHTLRYKQMVFERDNSGQNPGMLLQLEP